MSSPIENMVEVVPEELDYIERAKQLVRSYVDKSYKLDGGWLAYDVIVLWCMWTEKHSKVFLRTTKLDNKHFEITHDSETNASFVKVYSETDQYVVWGEKQ